MSSGNTELVSDATANSDDLLIEILVRLPLKSLIRFKSVSKHWQSLISSPQFSFRLYPDSHLVTGLILLRSSGLLNPEHDFLPLKNETTSTPIKCDTFLNHPSGLRILQSCGGLLCCSSLHDRKFQRDFYIYNPTTKQFVTLPRPSAKIYGINIAYDHARSPYYKVVCVRGSDSLEGIMNDHFSYQIEIYSSETRSWRISGDPFVAHASMLFENGVYWNGSIHWINCYDSLYFNVDEERLRAMPMPPTPIPDNWRFPRNLRYFGESREHFHVVEIHGPCATKLDVYEMERDYSRWFVKYRVDLDAITVAFPEMISSILSPADMDYYRFSILCIVREANDAESYMVLHIPGQYNIGSVRYLASLVEWLDAYQYIETLARV